MIITAKNEVKQVEKYMGGRLPKSLGNDVDDHLLEIIQDQKVEEGCYRKSNSQLKNCSV